MLGIGPHSSCLHIECNGFIAVRFSYLTGRLWPAFEDGTFSPLIQRRLTVIFSSLIVVLEMDFLYLGHSKYFVR